ncbi:hypothetical protein D3C75_1254370 [compost metagenome]
MQGHPVVALQHPAAALAQGGLVFGEHGFFIHGIAMLANDQVVAAGHGSHSRKKPDVSGG